MKIFQFFSLGEPLYLQKLYFLLFSMIVKIKSVSINGLSGTTVDVEVDVSKRMPAFNIVGLADTAVQESKERIRTAIKNS
jgi:hypothetical protein